MNSINDVSSAKAMCTITVGDLPIDIRWLKNGKILSSQKNARIAQVDDTLGVLTLSALTVDDSGNYSCSANNSAGVAIYTTSLYVKGVCLIWPLNIYFFLHIFCLFLIILLFYFWFVKIKRSSLITISRFLYSFLLHFIYYF